LSCQRAQELIHPYVDGELDGLQTVEVERHIEQCEDCKLDYRSQITLRSSLKDNSLYHRAPTNLKKRIRTSLQKEVGADVPQRIFSWGWAIAGASLAVLLAIGAVWKVVPLFMHPSSEELLEQEIVAAHIRSLQMPGHLTDVLSSDQHTIKPWFNGRVNFSPPVRDFADQDFRLYGGRLEYLDNRTVATVIYERRLHYINLYVWPAEQQQTTAEVTTQRQGYNLIHWNSSGLTCWAISDLNNVELRDFAHLVQQAY
jgi:anti-sigma factor RsiW